MSFRRGARVRVSSPAVSLSAGEDRGGAEFLFDAQKLVVLGDAVGAAGRARLDLAGVGGDGEVGDEGIFGFAGAVADDGGVSGVGCHLHGFERLGGGADLIDLYEDRIGDAAIDTLLEARAVGDE